MALKGEVVFVEVRGKAARVGARTPDGLVWFWTTTGPTPSRGQVVDIPPGAKPEPSRKNGKTAEVAAEVPAPAQPAAPSPEEVQRMLKAVALKAAAQLCAGLGPMAETQVLSLAERFLAWLQPQERRAF